MLLIVKTRHYTMDAEGNATGSDELEIVDAVKDIDEAVGIADKCGGDPRVTMRFVEPGIGQRTLDFGPQETLANGKPSPDRWMGLRTEFVRFSMIEDGERDGEKIRAAIRAERDACYQAAADAAGVDVTETLHGKVTPQQVAEAMGGASMQVGKIASTLGVERSDLQHVLVEEYGFVHRRGWWRHVPDLATHTAAPAAAE